MKKLTITFLVSIGCLFSTTSCKEYLEDGTNTDPSRTTQANVTLASLLPTVIFYTSDTHFAVSWVSSRYAQQIGDVVTDGLDAQRESTLSGAWTNIYLNTIPNLNIILRKAQETNSPHYAGVAKVLMAINLGVATTAWENVPYTQADKGAEGIFSPQYDTQEGIYPAIQKLLDEAIADLGQTQSTFRPGADDVAYAGNIGRWTRLAWTLKARYLMHLTKRSPAATTAQNALQALANGIQSNADDFQLVYNTRIFNPWHSNVALANNTGNLTITHAAYLINAMNGTTYPAVDPRLPLIANNRGAATYAGVQNGLGTGSGSNVSFSVDTWQSTATAPIQMCTFAEAKFLEAEARFLANGGTRTSTGSTDLAYTAYLDGIRASLSKLNVAAAAQTTYTTNVNVAMTAARLRLENIMIEKYKAMFLHPEVWTDLRRYDYDSNVYKNLALPANHNRDLNGQWIQRVSYPSTETTRNSEVARQNFKALNQKMWLFN